MKTLWTSKLLIMAVLCLTLNAENCETEIKVRRHTEYTAKIGQQLVIECPIQMCNNSVPTIKWFKFNMETDNFKHVNTSRHIIIKWMTENRVSILIFQKVFSSDMGQYQCHAENSVSHTINVTVTDGTVNVNGTSQDFTNGTFIRSHNDNIHMWLYLYTAVGIGGIVIIVMVISVLAMRGCNGKRKKKLGCENQCMDVPMIEQRQDHSSNQALPRGSPREPPSHRTSRKKKSPSPAPQRDNVYGQIDGDRERQRHGPVEEGSSVVYAALNHQHLAAATPRSWMVVEESSEYAAIRVS